ncbi:MAG: IS630 family transposase [Chloroflexota bacterium]|nr:IS630 family transposase [Chloroflexota bacterium]
MVGVATAIHLTEEEQSILESWVRNGTTEQRLVQRARMVLEAAAGKTTKEVAALLTTRPATVSKWRVRFARECLAGLMDAPGRGRRRRYGESAERRILAQLDEPPPNGYTTWTGPLVARALGDVSDDQVWRVLRKHGVQLQRRRSWRLSTDPQFAQKAADIVGLYLDPPENAVVISVDEKPSIQALERAQGWLRLPNGKALRGHTHEYKRHGGATLFAALEVHTGVVRVGHYRRKRRREFLDFMNGLLAQHPDTELHVILDNFTTHKPKHDRWLGQHPNVHFHYTPTHASWLNQIEVWFSILTRAVLLHLNSTNPRQVCQAIDRFTDARNEHPVPFEWTRSVVHPGGLKHRYADLCR